tara:strand:- start:664 stop:903 length:240 start_codon:yes stop_codon:yes gene_type:complete
LFGSILIIANAIEVLPEPPTTIFPMHIMGISKLCVFLKYVLMLKAIRYTIDKGSNKKEIILNIKFLLYQMSKNNLFKNL